MKFKFSDDLIVDSDCEPWKREGLRVGIYGGPGSTKSYSAAEKRGGMVGASASTR